MTLQPISLQADWVMTLAGFIFSVFIFSLIFGDNGLFRFAGSVLSGVIAAVLLLLLVEKVFFPLMIAPMLDPDSAPIEKISGAVATVLVVILIFLRYRRETGKTDPILMIAFFAMAALTLAGTISGTLLPLLRAVIAPFTATSEQTAVTPRQWAEAVWILVATLAALHSGRHYDQQSGKEKPSAGKSFSQLLDRFGEIAIAIAFGAIFAAVFISSALILIDHVSTMLHDGRTLWEGLFR